MKVGLVASILVSLFVISGCTNADTALRIVAEIVYIKDTKATPPVCFAVYYDKMAAVSCDNVEHLLLNE